MPQREVERCILFIFFRSLAMFTLLVPAECLSASLTLDASLKEIHETNLNPLLSGAGRSFAGDERERQLPAAARISSVPLRKRLVRHGYLGFLLRIERFCRCVIDNRS